MSDIHALQWRHNGRAGASNHQPHDCLLDRLFRRRSKKTSKLRVTDLCAGNSPVTGEFPTQRASNTENVSIWWRHHKHIGSRGLNKMADICWRYFQSTFLFGQIFIFIKNVQLFSQHSACRWSSTVRCWTICMDMQLRQISVPYNNGAGIWRVNIWHP